MTFHRLDEESFEELKASQNLKADYDNFLSLLVKDLNHCMKSPQELKAMFVIDGAEKAQMSFLQNVEYKVLEVIKLPFQAASEEIIRQSIVFRYNVLKTKVLYTQSKLRETGQLIKLKSPSILAQLEKSYQVHKDFPNFSSVVDPNTTQKGAHPRTNRL